MMWNTYFFTDVNLIAINISLVATVDCFIDSSLLHVVALKFLRLLMDHYL